MLPEVPSQMNGPLVETPSTGGAPERVVDAAAGDLREWMGAVERMGQLRRIDGAACELEIGAISELVRRESRTKPALLFDKIPGYPVGYRVLANPLKSVPQVAFTLNIPREGQRLEVVRAIRNKLKALAPIAPRVVASGPVLENVRRGSDVDVTAFPAPRWHEADGGRYLGTACVVITRDPETGWINLGTYRVMVHGPRELGVYISPGKDARIQMDKAFRAGKPFEIAISFGHDPLLFVAASAKLSWGSSEYEYAGGLRGAPIEVVEGPTTGLPIPAGSEIAVEGIVRPGVTKVEGPFGEFTGYYASGSAPAPVVEVKTVMHRHDPIILGTAPGRPPSSLHLHLMTSAMVWDAMEKAGVPDVRGVWQHEAAPNWMLTVVSIKQRYAGHARQAGLLASQVRGGAYMGRYIVVVDEDIDPSNLDDVIWALTTRSDPAQDIEILRRCWSGPLDPIIPEDKKGLNSRAIIDACRPFEWMDRFPPVVEVEPALREAVLAKWGPQILD
jgi:4-hydroxy-3-polyprenylbenzoate decarboxylase